MKILDHLEEWVIGLMLAAMTGLSFVQVVLRYVFNGGFTWTLELNTIFFAMMIFLGISYGVRVGSHIGVDALVKMLGHKAHRYVSMLAVLLSLVYVVFVLVGSYVYVSKMRQAGIEFEDLSIQRWQVLAVMPLGYLLTGYRFAQILWDLWTGKSEGLHLADEAAEALKLKAEEEQA